MSWDIYMLDSEREFVPVAPFMGGGTVMANPETMEEVPQVRAELNVTYNYSSLFDLAARAALYELGRGGYFVPSQERVMLEAWHEDGFRSLGGQPGWKVAGGLRLMIEQLDPGGRSRPGDDYWAATPANATVALRTILAWCEQAPHGTLHAH